MKSDGSFPLQEATGFTSGQPNSPAVATTSHDFAIRTSAKDGSPPEPGGNVPKKKLHISDEAQASKRMSSSSYRKLKSRTASLSLPHRIIKNDTPPRILKRAKTFHPVLKESVGRRAVFLRPQLQNAVVRSPYVHKKFIPQQQLLRIATPERVSRELLKIWLKKPWKTKVVPDPADSYQRILAILILMDRGSKIRMFVKRKITDNYLPFDKIPREDNNEKSLMMLQSRDNPQGPAPTFRKQADADDFFDHQWIVLAPLFKGPLDMQINHNEIHQEATMPFLSQKPIAASGFGQVFKTEIHPEHHDFSEAEKPCNVFAIKRLNSKNELDFEQEVQILKKLSARPHAHQHLINLLATYKYAGDYHLIFPWAETDLFGYWRNNQTPSNQDRAMADWIAEQCRGLAEGLNRIHRYETSSASSIFNFLPAVVGRPQSMTATLRDHSRTGDVQAHYRQPKRLFGRHGDLKPENILWFPDPHGGGLGTLKITDFGIARFNTQNLVSARERGQVPNSATYRSPECDLPYGELSTACDVWALGCIFLQFVTWFIGGYSYYEEFGRKRLAIDPGWAGMLTDTYFTILIEGDRKTAKVKDSVTQMIEELRSHRGHAHSDFFNGFLDVIQDDMLTIQNYVRNEENQQLGNINEQHAPTTALSRPSKASPRRKSSGDIFRTLGSLSRPHNDSDDDLSF
ncbi:kinase-like protein [Aaosphaeria arxii CBS 175.79]|uniref:Kinase-like protein n=1 Tax=Aaosphaeria arxii CBS 175.79 TaxID=1450172 RepID=A0A6A5XFK3_9PLEO|nr:kinase-like protein [Aaosphaeria arxii CBS 175.79]KAF2011918.1 kinase-like protein [Aaosphaeria arxii CBS 175.79]